MSRKSSISRPSVVSRRRDGMASALFVKAVGRNRNRDLARLGIDERGQGEDHPITKPSDDADDEEESEQAGHEATQVSANIGRAGEGSGSGENMLRIKRLVPSFSSVREAREPARGE